MAIKKTALKKLQKLHLSDNNSISGEELSKLGFDIKKRSHKIGNLQIEKGILSSSFEISTIDKNLDLDGNPLKDHPKLLSKLQSIWLDGGRSISWDDMKSLNIYTAKKIIRTGNFELSSNLGIFGKSYAIDLIDSNKDVYGRWNDNSTTVEKAIQSIKQFSKNAPKMATEKSFEKALFEHLEKHFHTVHQQVSIGGVKALKIDLDLADGKVGIELKMASKLINSSEKQRFIGQFHDYTTKRYKPGNFILAITGNKKLRTDLTIKEVKKIVESSSNYIYIEQ